MQVFFSGTVQGVGFRFTVDRLARQFEIGGYVRNLPDGKVELISEGEEAELQEFLKAVRESQMEPCIFNAEVLWKEPENQYQSFTIRTS